MTESLMGFTLGVLIVLIASLLWKAQGMARELARKWETSAHRIVDAQREIDELREMLADVEEKHGKFYAKMLEALHSGGTGASDAAIAQLAGRLSQLEKAHAAQDLTILETAEKVAHKLQDRRRKRDQAELGEIDDAPNDPAQLLAEARRAYGVTAPDPAQLQLIGGE